MAVNKVVFGTETVMDISDSTVSPETLGEGEKAYGANGEPVIGVNPYELEATNHEVSEQTSLIAQITTELQGKMASGGGGEDHLDDFLTNTLTAIDSDVTKIVSYGSYGRTALETVNLPKCTNIGSYAFRGCTGITSVDAPVATEIATYAFYGCSKLADINAPKVSTIGTYAFYKCGLRSVNFPVATGIAQNAFFQNENLEVADFGVANKINQAAFGNCSSLVALLLRRTGSICALGVASNAFSGSPIATGTGYVYVPAALVDTYKTATNWVNYATQFRALEDYTVDGTITGELDWDKVNAT